MPYEIMTRTEARAIGYARPDYRCHNCGVDLWPSAYMDPMTEDIYCEDCFLKHCIVDLR